MLDIACSDDRALSSHGVWLSDPRYRDREAGVLTQATVLLKRFGPDDPVTMWVFQHRDILRSEERFQEHFDLSFYLRLGELLLAFPSSSHLFLA